jgi:hypothetical protein
MMKLYNHSLQAQNQTGDVYISVGHFQVNLVKDDETVQSPVYKLKTKPEK